LPPVGGDSSFGAPVNKSSFGAGGGGSFGGFSMTLKP
jgi:hypothetical protein